jgi:invasion protein IalB
MSLRLNLLAVACAVLSPGAALAQPAQEGMPDANPAATAGKSFNPNEVVCEKQEETGSRLAVRRVCMTRSQWADRKSQDRQEIERVQTQRGSVTPP